MERFEGASQAPGDAVALVRFRSARHRITPVLGGHERAASDSQGRRSHAYRRSDLGRRRKPALGSNPTSSAFP